MAKLLMLPKTNGEISDIWDVHNSLERKSIVLIHGIKNKLIWVLFLDRIMHTQLSSKKTKIRFIQD